MVSRVGAAESQQDEYHDPEKCAEDDSVAGKPLLQEHVDGRQEEPDNSSSAFASGSCEKQYWTCPGDAGFKVYPHALTCYDMSCHIRSPLSHYC